MKRRTATAATTASGRSRSAGTATTAHKETPRKTPRTPDRKTAAAGAAGATPASAAAAGRASPARKRTASKPAASAPAPAPKRIRDRFSMPEDDYALIRLLKQRAAAAGRPTKKNELLRAGLHALRESGTVELVKALDRLPKVRRKHDRKDADPA